MLTIRAIQQDDSLSWNNLYKKYLKCYNTMLSEQQMTTLRDWFFDADKKIYCFLALNDNHVVGFVHFREFLRPIKASTGIFMDDLFVDDAFRGHGIAQRLIKSVEDFTRQKDIAIIRWVTGDDNHDAMRVYNKMAAKTQWVTYDLVVKSW